MIIISFSIIISGMKNFGNNLCIVVGKYKIFLNLSAIKIGKEKIRAFKKNFWVQANFRCPDYL